MEQKYSAKDLESLCNYKNIEKKGPSGSFDNRGH